MECGSIQRSTTIDIVPSMRRVYTAWIAKRRDTSSFFLLLLLFLSLFFFLPPRSKKSLNFYYFRHTRQFDSRYCLPTKWETKIYKMERQSPGKGSLEQWKYRIFRFSCCDMSFSLSFFFGARPIFYFAGKLKYVSTMACRYCLLTRNREKGEIFWNETKTWTTWLKSVSL